MTGRVLGTLALPGALPWALCRQDAGLAGPPADPSSSAFFLKLSVMSLEDKAWRDTCGGEEEEEEEEEEPLASCSPLSSKQVVARRTEEDNSHENRDLLWEATYFQSTGGEDMQAEELGFEVRDPIKPELSLEAEMTKLGPSFSVIWHQAELLRFVNVIPSRSVLGPVLLNWFLHDPELGEEVKVAVKHRRGQGCRRHPVFQDAEERARDYLHKTGRFIVIGGIVSPVHDSYGKQATAPQAQKPKSRGQPHGLGLIFGESSVAECVPIPPTNESHVLQGLVSSRHRLTMCQLAVQSSDWIRVDPWECYQDTWQTTCSVLEHHRDLMKASGLLWWRAGWKPGPQGHLLRGGIDPS
ncbi:Nicotinamide/nicotinic acid mononucleotide adenylyltransferase 2 [Varanus komodoensis]|nr:Nicotinamide/nicotinic acid mononucleotide adenylyltransferase 2 [Varanus komodoensis]